MENTKILVDGSQLLTRDGTGISSYTRTLVSSLRMFGAEVGLLFEKKITPYKKNTLDISSAMELFGNAAHRTSKRQNISLAANIMLKKKS